MNGCGVLGELEDGGLGLFPAVGKLFEGRDGTPPANNPPPPPLLELGSTQKID